MRAFRSFYLLAVTLSAVAVVCANSDSPPSGYAGAPGEETCAAVGCHEVPSGRLGGLWTVRTSSASEDTVWYVVYVSDRTAGSHVVHWGFQLTALDSLDQPFGEILVSDTVRTKVVIGSGGRQYLSQTASGVPFSHHSSGWSFRWLRPTDAAKTDLPDFYAAGVLSDGDGTLMNEAVVTAGPVFCPLSSPPGDANLSHSVTSADVIYLVGYLFKGGAEPVPCPAAGDCNCDAKVTSADIIFLVNYVFKSGSPPCDVCPLILDGTWDCS